MKDEQQFCTFSVDGFFFGVPVARVQEVVRHQDITPVPLSPPEISGLINLRGQIITAIDLRRRLGLPDRPAGQQPNNVLIHAADGSVSFLVDQIEDVLSVPLDSLEPPPATLQESLRRFLRGVSKQQDRLLLWLDEAKAMDLAC